MRPIPVGKREQHAQPLRNYHRRVEIQNLDGDWKDLRNLLGVNWIDSWDVEYNTDNQVATFTVELMRETEDFSLAPLMGGSEINRLADDSYSPLIFPNRNLRILTATTDAGVAPVAGDWDEIISGTIDDIGWANDPINITGRDKGAKLQDSQIKEPVVYNEEENVALADQIIALAAPVLAEADIVVLDDDGAEVGAYTQDLMNRMEAIQAIAQLSGISARYKYGADGVSRFTIYNLDRDKVVPDLTFGPSEYFAVNNLNISKTDIRNYVDVYWMDTAGIQHKVTRTDPSSIAEFDERYMRIGNEATKSLITSNAAAIRLAEVARAELSRPFILHEVECSYIPYIELGDLCEWIANNKHYDSNQKLAVFGFRHSDRNGDITTTIQTRGKPAAFKKRWFRLEAGDDDEGVPLDITVPPLISFTVEPLTNKLSVLVQGGPGTYTTRCLARVDRPPTGEELDASAPATPGRSGLFTDIPTLPSGKVITGRRFYIAGRAYNANGEGTVIAREVNIWLGIDATPGADVTLGTIVSMADKISIMVAFDNECAYCKCYYREYTVDPGAPVSMENLVPQPFKILTLGPGGMVPGIAQPVVFPIAAPDNYIIATFVPFDHLDKRGTVKNKKVQGNQGIIGGPGTFEDPVAIFGADLIVWLDPTQETVYEDEDELGTITDFSGNDNDFEADWTGEGVNATIGNGLFLADQVNGKPMFQLRRETTVFHNLNQWFRSAPELIDADDPCFLLIVAKSLGKREHNIFARFGNTINAYPDDARVTEMPDVDGIFWKGGNGNNNMIITDAPTSELFAYAIRFSSPTEALQWFNGNVDTDNGEFDPHTDFSGLMHLQLGSCWALIGDVILATGIPTLEQVDAAFNYVLDKWNTSTGPGEEPDPFPLVEFVSATTATVTFAVTMPAVAPDFIRVLVDGVFNDDIIVTAAGGAIQSVTVLGLSPDTTYTFDFIGVNGSFTSAPFTLNAATDASEGVELDPPIEPVVGGISYYAPEQQTIISVEPGANNPVNTIYHVELSDDIAGPYFYRTSGGLDELTGMVTIAFGTLQRTLAYTIFFRVWGESAGWDASDKIILELEVPAK